MQAVKCLTATSLFSLVWLDQIPLVASTLERFQADSIYPVMLRIRSTSRKLHRTKSESADVLILGQPILTLLTSEPKEKIQTKAIDRSYHLSVKCDQDRIQDY